MLSIVTDGLPTCTTSGVSTHHDRLAFIQELRHFTQTFNSFVVIRLCTDDEDIVDFYNKIDEEVELPLDILDDIQGEAKEVFDSGNGWLTYSPLIHRVREGGTTNKLFDLLDERALDVAEIAVFAQYALKR